MKITTNNIIAAKSVRKMMKASFVNPKVARRHTIKIFNRIIMAARNNRCTLVYGVQAAKYPLISCLSNILLEQGYKVSQRERSSYTALKIGW